MQVANRFTLIMKCTIPLQQLHTLAFFIGLLGAIQVFETKLLILRSTALIVLGKYIASVFLWGGGGRGTMNLLCNGYIFFFRIIISITFTTNNSRNFTE